MTGWAQVNGLRGDTSIAERTKYDLWYSENWSILLDVKIILRTVWQIFEKRSQQRSALPSPTTTPTEATTISSVPTLSEKISDEQD